MADGDDPVQNQRLVRRLHRIGVDAIIDATASQFGVVHHQTAIEKPFSHEFMPHETVEH